MAYSTAKRNNKHSINSQKIIEQQNPLTGYIQRKARKIPVQFYIKCTGIFTFFSGFQPFDIWLSLKLS